MKKENAYKLCHLIAALFMIGFPLKIIKDWVTYNSTLNSAPFYLWILVDGIFLLIPAGILFLIGWLLKKKYRK